MITHEEIDATANELDISIPNVERDYVFGWLLAGIFQETQIGQRLVHKGGNELRKAYLPFTRISDDLDFSTADALIRDDIVPQLNQASRFATDSSGVEFDLDRNDIYDEHSIDKEGLEALFAPFGYGRMLERAFFPAELRNPILEADGERRLIEMRYHGVTRLIEPYALTFKRRKSDGVAQEYFYGWDQTGGQRSAPGIKSFLAPDIAMLAVTDRTFEPRFEIELAKAGDASSSGYFTGTTGRRLIPGHGSTLSRRRGSSTATAVTAASVTLFDRNRVAGNQPKPTLQNAPAS